MNKQLFFLICGTFLTLDVFASCFSDYYSQGQSEENRGRYEQAILKYEAAVICNDVTDAQKRQALDRIKKAQEKRIQVVEESLAKAKAAEEAALAAQKVAEDAQKDLQLEQIKLKQQLRITEANRLATLAAKELEVGDRADGLTLAYLALRSVEEAPMANVKRSFGEAVLHNYQDTLGKKPEASLRTAFSADGRYAMTIAPGDTVLLWENGRDLPLARLAGHTGPISALAFSPDGQFLLTGSADQTARIWTLNGRMIMELKGHTAEVTGLTYGPGGNRILTWSRDRTARLWDSNGRLIATLMQHQAPILAGAFANDGLKILTRGADQMVMLWDSQGRPLSPGIRHPGYVFAAQWSPDGQTLLTGSAKGGSGLWAANGQPVAAFAEHRGAVTAVDFSADGQYLLSADVDGKLVIRNAQGRPLATVNTGSIVAAGFSPDGQLAFTASKDRTLKLWDLQGRQVGFTMNHLDDILSADFLPDNRHLISTSLDGTAKLWDRAGDVVLNYQGAAHQLVSANYSARDGHLLFVSQQEPPLFCQNPAVVYASLQRNPPVLSAAKQRDFGIGESDFGAPVSPVTNPPPPLGAYRVQLGVFRDASGFDESRVSSLGKIVFTPRNNATVVSIAGMATRSDAERVRDQAKAAGFRDAFVVAEETAPDPVPTPSPGFTDPGLPTNPAGTNPEPAASAGYKIQVAAVRQPENFDTTGLDKYGTIELEPVPGRRLTRIFISQIQSLTNAQKALAEAKAAGFSDAFILQLENGEWVRVR